MSPVKQYKPKAIKVAKPKKTVSSSEEPEVSS